MIGELCIGSRECVSRSFAAFLYVKKGTTESDSLKETGKEGLTNERK